MKRHEQLTNYALAVVNEKDDISNKSLDVNKNKKLSKVAKAAAILCLSVTSMAATSTSHKSEYSPQSNKSRVENNADSNNWAGFEVDKPFWTGFDYIKEDMIVPALNCPETGSYKASAWVGLGSGNGTDTLYQTGLEMDCNNGTASYSDWWEDFPTEVSQAYSYTRIINVNDKIVAYTARDQYGIELEVYDYTPNTSGGYDFNWEDSHQLNVGSMMPGSAECITERPTYAPPASGYSALTNFGTIYFPVGTDSSPNVGCDASDGTYNFVLSDSGAWLPGITTYDMYNSVASPSAYPLAVNNGPTATGAYSVTWEVSS
jgi:hypothetical protein